MSPSTKIQMAFQERIIYEVTTNAWEFIYTKKWKWIEKLCFLILKKTGCLHIHMNKDQYFYTITIDKDQTVLAIINQAKDKLDNIGVDIKQILIGRDQFNEICGNSYHFQRPFEFDVELPYNERQSDNPYFGHITHIKYLNIPIRVIPWMDGILII